MDTVIDPNFDQLIIICGVICIIVIGFVLLMNTFPDEDSSRAEQDKDKLE